MGIRFRLEAREVGLMLLIAVGVYAVIAYYLAHQAEVDAYVWHADEQADRVQREVEAGYTPATRALIERLRAAREQSDR